MNESISKPTKRKMFAEGGFRDILTALTNNGRIFTRNRKSGNGSQVVAASLRKSRTA
jgi:hypothetical protein